MAAEYVVCDIFMSVGRVQRLRNAGGKSKATAQNAKMTFICCSLSQIAEIQTIAFPAKKALSKYNAYFLRPSMISAAPTMPEIAMMSKTPPEIYEAFESPVNRMKLPILAIMLNTTMTVGSTFEVVVFIFPLVVVSLPFASCVEM